MRGKGSGLGWCGDRTCVLPEGDDEVSVPGALPGVPRGEDPVVNQRQLVPEHNELAVTARYLEIRPEGVAVGLYERIEPLVAAAVPEPSEHVLRPHVHVGGRLAPR